MSRQRRLENRPVEVADPSLSPEANRALTEEVRNALGTDHVEVPADQPLRSPGSQTGPAARLSMRRALWVGSLAAALTIGAIISLATGSWWFLALAAGVHALGTLAVTTTTTHLMAIVERPAPNVAAMLEEEGVSDPDEYFSRLVTEFAEAAGSESTHSGELEGSDREANARPEARETPANEDPAAATIEQQTAVTPTGERSRPVGSTGVPPFMVGAVLLSMSVLSIVLPLAFGGRWLWLVPAVTVPAAAGGSLGTRWAATASPKGQPVRKTRLGAVLAATVATVVVFCVLVALFVH